MDDMGDMERRWVRGVEKRNTRAQMENTAGAGSD
jgi:hypothetical protein